MLRGDEMIVKVIKEMRIAVPNSYEEYQILTLLDALGVRYTIDENSEEGVKVFRVNLQNR